MNGFARFSTGEIRRHMDVYTFDAQYIGSVLWIRSDTSENRTPELDPAVLEFSEIDGEAFGPAPTQSVGNRGPVKQSARQGYATQAIASATHDQGELIVGKYFGLLGLRRVPIEDIQTVALERIVLRKTYEELD
jgi:hypothetical protein